ncbi:MinD/ParA family protein [Actinomadura sp. 6K520]|uniref:MinD/ParA family ATP-binding protein n=1 Tax=Actinomadura sp. 6K520 TaxID=2530364 RepID=UPI001FB703AF|nr:MinD/ParA family protein [Actinomadura sp. 6K520]
MARNEHEGRSLEERLASLDAMSGEPAAQSPAPAAEGEQGAGQAPAEQENAPPEEDAQPQVEQTDPNANPWLAAPPSFQQPPETGYPPQTFGPPQPPPYEGGPMPQPFDGGMLPPPYAAGYPGHDPSQAPQPPYAPQQSPYDANGNTAPPLDQLPPYPADQQDPGAAGQPYQPIDPATGRPFPQDTDASGQPYVPIDPGTGRPFPPDPNATTQYTPADPTTAQPFPQDPNAAAQPYQPVDPNTGQPYAQDPNAAAQPYQPVDPNTGQPFPPDPNAAAQPYQPVDPNTGQPYAQEQNAAGQYQPVDPSTGQPYAPDPNAAAQPYQPVDPNTGQPYAQEQNAAGQYQPVDPNTGQPYAPDPNAAGAPYPPVDPATGQPVQGYGYPPALNQMMQPAPGYPGQQPPPQQPQNADNLSSENLLGERRIAPSSGWRRAVYKATAGGIHPGESQSELRRKDLIARARTVVAGGHHRVAVMSLKGGVGKTTTTTGLGSMLGSLRGDRVIAVDANPDRGTLSDKVRLETAATVRDLLNNRDQIHRYADVRAFTSQNEARLEILASDRDPAVSEAFSADDYAAVAVVLEQYYSVCITDCGTGLLHSAMAGVLSLADQLVLVSSPSVDGARSASATLDWLEAHDHGHLVRNGVVVLSMVRNRTRSQVDLDKLQAHFESRCRAVVRIPYDDHLEEGAEVELEQLAPATREAYLHLAAVVGDGFAFQRPTDS